MDDGQILTVILTVTIDTMLNNNGVNNGHEQGDKRGGSQTNWKTQKLLLLFKNFYNMPIC